MSRMDSTYWTSSIWSFIQVSRVAFVTWQFSLVALIIHTTVLRLDLCGAGAETCLCCWQPGTVVTSRGGPLTAEIKVNICHLRFLADVAACAFSSRLGSGKSVCAWQVSASWLSCPPCWLFLSAVWAFLPCASCGFSFVKGMSLLHGPYGCSAVLLAVGVTGPSFCIVTFKGIDWKK